MINIIIGFIFKYLTLFFFGSVLLNIILATILIFEKVLLPSKFKKFIIIDESKGGEQISIDWGKEQDENKIKLRKRKVILELDSESGEGDNIRFIDKKGKPLYVIRTNGEKYTYCTYEGGVIQGLTRNQREFFKQQRIRADKQYTPKSLNEWWAKNGLAIATLVIFAIGMAIAYKTGAQQGETLVTKAMELINTLKASIESINMPGGLPGV